MKGKPFTIQTYFPNGNPRSIQISHVPTRTVQSILIPRDDLKEAISLREELNYNGLYFLFEEEGYLQANGETFVYIGESEDVADRLKNHVTNKKDWIVAIVFTTNSETNQLTKADIKYLENYCYQKSLEANRYKLKQNVPKKSFISEARRADLEDIFQSISTLLNFSGYPLFMPLVSSDNLSTDQEIFYLNIRQSSAKAVYSKDGMTVLKGSKITAKNETKGFQRQKLLNQLIISEVIDASGMFLKDYTFTAPSTAADILSKGSYNGWKEWKNVDSKTLDELIERNS
ncbi:GIY-YIG nuclease family protein [Enterococcus thailandicus]|uniref:GIY-YIG nuclease family protein n=1 Tax=Enterococcus thailandicus TaxID=417368 RepID=UPI0022EC1413|nr:GIY-YIG nuclease family protein [Enterococcus thailandicus]MDA3973523.1 GIY-YIG nuclease family protein [Enterococcus thailandicus]MDA3975892.1 GIY-YIG nuclease family protein [Enterococcus thailandicus]MDA3980982.1 GIY-YIG nuclease family protein [Enterococcus thailandicus]